jgi:hypothetical protein
MKSLQDFKHIIEEEKQDYSKFDALVRAGLGNKAQIQRLHQILGKMEDEKPNFSTADRAIIQNIFNKLIDLVTTNKQINAIAKRAVREETEDLSEGVIDTSDFKVGKDGRKVRAHRVTLGDKGITEPVMPVAESIELSEAAPNDPPFVLVLKRKAIRLYPDGTKIALYYNDRTGKSFSIPYGPNIDSVVQAEETQLEEAVDPVKHLQKIKDTHQMGTVNHKDGTASKIDAQTAHALLTVHKSLNGENKKKFSDMMARSNGHMQKAAEFAWKQFR